MTAPYSTSTTPTLSTPSISSAVIVLSTPTPPSPPLAPVVVDIGLIAGVVTAGVLLVLVIVIVTTCCTVWCRRDKTARLNSVSDLVSHFNSNRAISQTAVALEEIADSHERANEDLLNIPDQDYEVITSDNDAYQAASLPGRDSRHVVSNEAYAVSTNPMSEDHEYSYVDENYVTGIGTQGEENQVITSYSISDQAATDHAKLTSDKEDRENTNVNDSPLSSPDLENEVTTFVNVAYEGVNRHNSNQDDLCLDSNVAYNIMSQI